MRACWELGALGAPEYMTTWVRRTAIGSITSKFEPTRANVHAFTCRRHLHLYHLIPTCNGSFTIDEVRYQVNTPAGSHTE